MEPVRTEPLLVRINLDVGLYGAEAAKCSALIAAPVVPTRRRSLEWPPR
jgi:hypothetical protein